MNLDKTCNLSEGVRDAVHVPVIVVKIDRKDNDYREIVPGSYVRFTDAKFTKVEECLKSESHGVINPFIDEIGMYDRFVVFLNPGISGPVRHDFDIDLNKREVEKTLLELELEERKKEDSECAGCYAIKNGEIIRY